MRGLARFLMVLGLFAISGCQQFELSFKTIRFRDAEYDVVFDACHQELRHHYTGLVMRVDREKGQIETDPAEFQGKDGIRREQVYVDVQRVEGGDVEVALMAPISAMEVNPADEPAVRWVTLGSDGTQEHLLLDGIVGEVLRRQPRASLREE